MDTKPKYPPYLYLVSALIGGVMGVISFFFVYILLTDPGATGDLGWVLLAATIISGPLAVGGALFGIISGRIGYAIKPRKGASIGGAALGGALAPILVSLLYASFSTHRESAMVSQIQHQYPEHKPISSLVATYQELASGGLIEACPIGSDGSQLAVDSNSLTTMLELKERTQLGQYFLNGRQYGVFAFSLDGSTLAYGAHGDRTLPRITVWDMHTGGQLSHLEGEGDVHDIAFSPDGRLLVALYSSSWRIILWDPSTGEKVTPLEGPSRARSLAIRPDGKIFAVDEANQITLWDTATLKPVGQLKLPAGGVVSLAFSPDGTRLAAVVTLANRTSDPQIEAGIGVWDIDNRTFLTGSQAPGTSSGSKYVGFSPDGRKLITYGGGEEILYLWDANSLEPLGSITGPQADRSEAFILPDGRVLACYWNDSLPDRIGIWTIESP